VDFLKKKRKQDFLFKLFSEKFNFFVKKYDGKVAFLWRIDVHGWKARHVTSEFSLLFSSL
jgi:hypothetical protein